MQTAAYVYEQQPIDPTELSVWMRDWAIIGFLTCALAPGLVATLISGELWPFAAVASCLGAVSGSAVGWMLRSLLNRVPDWSWVAVSLFAGVPALGAWGALVSGCAALLTVPHMLVFAVPCGTVSALLQCSWMAPAYAMLARAGWSRLPMVVLGPLVAGPLAGMLCIATVVSTLQLVNQL